MSGILWLIPFFPLAGFVILSLLPYHAPKKLSSFIGVLMPGLSTLAVSGIAVSFIAGLPSEHVFTKNLWTWIDVPGFYVNMGFYLDSLTLVFVFIVSFVSFLIHLYSAGFMKQEEGVNRFFSWMNLFTASMLVLVMADNLLMLYLGWEGVGLCSYLLIGFWYKDPANGYAARKAFIITRIGDTAMAIGLFFLFRAFGTFNIQDILRNAPEVWSSGSAEANIAAALLLAGALGKSAQLPLQTWLPDAMAGPSPVSALIHAATMVTAGVYLIARVSALFILAPVVQTTVAVIGALTLLLAAFSALVQRDIKRVLAYSTISQIGYMFLALGAGAWSAGIFHFFTHAFFKALLFLAAGVIIMKLDHEHDMFSMGGLREKMPLTFYTFLAGAASLAALPLVTAGFYSKDMILVEVFSYEKGGILLWIAGIAGAGLTALYTFRMVFLTFYGEIRKKPAAGISATIGIPLVILAILALTAGFIGSPFRNGLQDSLPVGGESSGNVSHILLQVIAAVVVIAGIISAWYMYMKIPAKIHSWKDSTKGRLFYYLWKEGWGFDFLYRKTFIEPYNYISRINKNDVLDNIYTGLAAGVSYLHRKVILTQTGNLRWYLAFIVAGLIVGFTLIVFS